MTTSHMRKLLKKKTMLGITISYSTNNHPGANNPNNSNNNNHNKKKKV